MKKIYSILFLIAGLALTSCSGIQYETNETRPQTVGDAVQSVLETMDEQTKSQFKFIPKEESLNRRNRYQIDIIAIKLGVLAPHASINFKYNRGLLEDCKRIDASVYAYEVIAAALWTALQTMPVTRYYSTFISVSLDSSHVVQGEIVGGKAALSKVLDYLVNKTIPPEIARRAGVQGQSVLDFEISAIGTVKSIEVINRLGAACEESLIDVLQMNDLFPTTESPLLGPAKVRIFVNFAIIQPPPTPPEDQ